MRIIRMVCLLRSGAVITLSKSFKPKILSILAVVVVIAAMAAGKSIYDLAAAPKGERSCDFVYPGDPNKPAADASRAALDGAAFEVEQAGGTINDASCLDKTAVYGIARIRSEQDISAALKFARDNGLKVTPAGARHSMGGQSFSRGGLVLDMREFNRIAIDKAGMTMNVQSGARWKDVQKKLDREGLAVKAMQSINIFTVGGTLSVNAHGVAHDPGQVAPTVRSMRVMLSSGETRNTSPTENAELFSAVLGGYGLIGIILDVDLEIVANEVFAWKTAYMDYKDFPAYYSNEIVGNDEVGLVYARLSISPTSYLTELVVHKYERIDFDVEPEPLSDPSKTWFKRLIFNLSKTGGFGRWLRWTAEKNIEPGYHKCITRLQGANGAAEEVCVATRNEKMNQSMDYLNVRQEDTNILHEYFIPLEYTAAFIDGLRDTVQQNDVNLLNVTLRIVTRDTVTALPYAKDDRIAYVLYFNQKLNEEDSENLRKATVELIDLAIANGGTFYLPYQLFYSPQQLRAAYPEIDDFFKLKKKYDPIGLLTNKFYEKYAF